MYSIWRVWGIRSGSLSLWSSKWTVVCAKWPTPHCSANLLELGSKMHLRTPWGLWSGWFIIAKYCTSMVFKLFFGESDFLRPFLYYRVPNMVTAWQPTYLTYLLILTFDWENVTCISTLSDIYRIYWCAHFLCSTKSTVQDLPSQIELLNTWSQISTVVHSL